MDDENFSFAAHTLDTLPQRSYLVMSKIFFHLVKAVFQDVLDDERRKSFARAVTAVHPNRKVFRGGAFLQRLDRLSCG